MKHEQTKTPEAGSTIETGVAQRYIDAIPENARKHVFHKLGELLHKPSGGGVHTLDDGNGDNLPPDSGNTPPPPTPPHR